MDELVHAQRVDIHYSGAAHWRSEYGHSCADASSECLRHVQTVVFTVFGFARLSDWFVSNQLR